MELGTFSVSLAVNNLATSRAFYEKLGFAVIREDQAQSWLILRCGETTIGLFQGVFPRNTLTFNPGLRGSTMVPLDDFDDVREIQAHLKHWADINWLEYAAAVTSIWINIQAGNIPPLA